VNLSLNRLPWYGQIGAFVLIGVAGAGVFWTYYAQPTAASIAQRQTQLAQLRAQIDNGLRNAQRLPEIRRDIAAREAQLEQLRQRLPEEKDVADLLRRIQAMATQSNLTIRGFTPQAVTNRQLYVEWPIGLQVEGTYHNLGAFLERISRFPRIINVTGITIRAKDQQTAADTITAEATAMTFVMTEPPAAAAAPAAPPGGAE
jgi:type IV pilus assembly protein PilO